MAENVGGNTTALGAPWHFTTIAGSGIAEDHGTALAPGMAIGPNPLATGCATLRYSLPRAGTVSISVADVTGRTVMTRKFNLARTGSTALDLHQLSAGVFREAVGSRVHDRAEACHPEVALDGKQSSGGRMAAAAVSALAKAGGRTRSRERESKGVREREDEFRRQTTHYSLLTSRGGR